MLSNFSDSMVNANSEGDALIAFKQSLSDPTNVLKSWDQNLVDPCSWYFVKCNTANQVIRLCICKDVESRNLAGHLVPQLGNLQYLQYLSLNKNQLQGSIPTELGNLKSLVALELQDNNLTGTIPPSLGNLKSLVFLRLSNNRGLIGDIPQEVSNLPNLKVL
ncbi:leucine-rich repeat protein 2-like [Rhododendron vialii]|uniref:leucine-rich repeat protein 2-like n=1 Tax=Rhododendron vialii TaxID=182163 RepID=UPI00265F66F0|nr:leucine-rich repeat protein 2-like [Rhododendron vialii]